jgi:hypothetical protein
MNGTNTIYLLFWIKKVYIILHNFKGVSKVECIFLDMNKSF